MADDLHTLPATRAAAGIVQGDFTATELAQSCIDRIAEREEAVHAWHHFDPEVVLAQAAARDQQTPTGVLHGIPVGIKDIIDTRTMPTCYGSEAYRDHQPQQDATCVDLLQQAGAIIMGKTVTTEFAFYAPGPTANPHKLSHTPGGSSSGSAAAVADFHVPLALGTQTAGSIIRPAAYTGTIGYKPAYDTFSLTGVHPLAPSMDTLGGFAREVGDLALLKGVLTERPPVPLSAAKPDAVAFVRSPVWEQASPQTQAAIEQFVTTLAASGVRIIEPNDHPLAGLPELQLALLAHGASQTLGDIANKSGDKLRPETLQLIEMGAQTDPALFDKLAEATAVAQTFLQEVFSEADLIITASAPAEAPVGLQATGDPVFNRIWTLLKLPCINLPLIRIDNGLPLGVQLVGQLGGDDALLAQAQYCTELIDYH
ncbi:MAG: amidase [Gammaproteobacteria bacterium]